MVGTLIGEVLETCRSAIDILKDRKRSRKARKEFWALGLDECTGMLNDIGLTRSEFDAAMRLPHASEDLFSLAMDSIGVDPDGFRTRQIMQSRFMPRTCIICQYRRSCRRHIANLDFASHYREFCPNGSNFTDLLKEQALQRLQ